MKIDLTYKEANILSALIWELAEEGGVVCGPTVWKLSEDGADTCRAVFDKLEEANDKANRKSGKTRDLSGAPKGSILDAGWSA